MQHLKDCTGFNPSRWVDVPLAPPGGLETREREISFIIIIIIVIIIKKISINNHFKKDLKKHLKK